jgi:hypothetical protein
MEELWKKTENPIGSCLGSSAYIPLAFKVKREPPPPPANQANSVVPHPSRRIREKNLERFVAHSYDDGTPGPFVTFPRKEFLKPFAGGVAGKILSSLKPDPARSTGQEVGAEVIRNIFSRRRPSEKETGEDFDRVISKIERFAPKQYRPERDSHYYNYRMLNPYVSPLLGLLIEISNHSRLNEDALLLKGLFEKLKAFYDPRHRLSLTEASKDLGLRRKFVDMLSYFYGEKGTSEEGLELFFRDMNPRRGQRNEAVE